MEITNNYLLFVLFICISSITLGIITIMNIDNKFDGLIINNDGGPLDIEKYFNTKIGQLYLSAYLNNNINDSIFVKKNKPIKIYNIKNQTDINSKDTLFYEKDNNVEIIFTEKT